MGSLSVWHLLILLAVVVILFGGGGKLSRIMGDFGKGINSFKAGLKDEETRRREEEEARTGTIQHAQTVGAPAAGTQTVEPAIRQDEVVRR
jgi:sec-independent protein translocase protein TatA